VDKQTSTSASPVLPVTFQSSISLEGYEVPGGSITRGKALVVILNWRAASPVQKDYSVFAHLVNSNGDLIAGYDGPPKRGALPTSTWRPAL